MDAASGRLRHSHPNHPEVIRKPYIRSRRKGSYVKYIRIAHLKTKEETKVPPSYIAIFRNISKGLPKQPSKVP